MKKSILILFFLAAFFSVNNVNAQANVTATGISIQGIARDENNSALSNIDQLSLNFRIYYLDGSNAEVQILNLSDNVRTDNFGVFSYVMNIPNTVFTQICNTSAYLKVTQGSVVFSNEKLQAVPYAIHAQNGVPTGTIMAYIGSTAPTGWLLCDGSTFTDNATNAKLKELLGSTTTPNLNARFLRGTGTVSGRQAIDLKGTQDDATKEHNHGVGTLATSTTGNHTHTNDGFDKISKADNRYWVNWSNTSSATATTPPQSPLSRLNVYDNISMLTTGDHSHTISGSTANSGNSAAGETRVFAYGVNWIIKI
jgi:microcystin-dependent protein